MNGTNMPAPQAPTAAPKQLRVLSVNACCLAGGLRNERLPALSIGSGSGLVAVLYITAMSLLVALPRRLETGGINWAYFGVGLVPMFFLCFFVGHVFALQVARLVGNTISCCTGRHDFKKERLLAFAEDYFVDYDVVAVQELFEAWPKCCSSRYPQLLIHLAKEKGFEYHAKPDGVHCPSVAQQSGLLILSRYPIIESKHLVFGDQYFGDKYAVNRGAMYAKIELPSTLASHLGLPSTGPAPFHFFTCHISPQMKSLGRGCPQFVIKWGDSTRIKQFLQFSAFIKRLWKNKGVCVVAGDFNADIRFPEANQTVDPNTGHRTTGAPVPNVAYHTVIEHMTKIGLHNVGGLVPTYGYLNNDDGSPVETLLTSTRQRHEMIGDDLIFSSDECKRLEQQFRPVPLVAAGRPFTHLSDHQGVSLTLKKRHDK
eukprot:Stramenopile-MAST_4_protein_1039